VTEKTSTGLLQETLNPSKIKVPAEVVGLSLLSLLLKVPTPFQPKKKILSFPNNNSFLVQETTETTVVMEV